MSFAYDLKTELCKLPFEQDCCKKAQLYGMLLFGRHFASNHISIQTEHSRVSGITAELLEQIYNIKQQVKISLHSNEHTSYTLNIIDKILTEKIFNDFGYDLKTVTLRINRSNIESDCCVSAFLRGIFLVCGSVAPPEKNYHLEFVAPHYNLCKDLSDFLKEQDLKPKSIKRKGNYIIYFKESEQVEDILTLMGAFRQSLEIMNIKIYKDIRNNANRVTNCETANIDKTVGAASAQLEAIKKIVKAHGIDFFKDELREIAVLRLENPEMSLRELSDELKISRSGANHRLRRIIDIANTILN
jgi:DNA-binding protein WhiA